MTALCLCAVAWAADPSEGWLSYAQFAAGPTDTITHLEATMVVPDAPTHKFGGSPAFWFGVQTHDGAGALVQPIMAKWLGDGWFMFQEIFDWWAHRPRPSAVPITHTSPRTDGRDEQSRHLKVPPGDVIYASLSFDASQRAYAMNMTSSRTGRRSSYSYALLPQQKATESVAYFVLEHQPDR